MDREASRASLGAARTAAPGARPRGHGPFGSRASVIRQLTRADAPGTGASNGPSIHPLMLLASEMIDAAIDALEGAVTIIATLICSREAHWR